MKSLLLLAASLILLASPAYAESITADDVRSAQQAWGNAIVAIGAAASHGAAAPAAVLQTVASNLIENLYAYDVGPVLFKPTKAAAVPFRDTLDEAISYFIGGSVPEDHGFARQPWSAVRFGDQQITIDSDSATAMGHYYFTDANTEAETMVEFTFGYLRDPQGRLRINVHHSSLPYSPAQAVQSH